jgi:glucose/arabinose dehydrogenase
MIGRIPVAVVALAVAAGASADSPPGPSSARMQTGPSAAATGQAPGDGRGGIILRRVARVDTPTYVTAAPGFPRLLFVTEQPGRVRVLSRGRKRARPFLDIRGLVRSTYEEGLFSLAFHPRYRRNRLFYVFYVDNRGDIRIDEFKRRSRLRAARGSRRPVVRIRHQPATTHMGGQLAFLGRFLYISTGDGGGVGDPGDDAKSKRSLLGKILRIDPRNPRGPASYRVPRSNPFVGRRGRNQIFAYGLRNPWRFSFDRVSAKRPRIVIADVGQERFEEVDYERLGRAKGAFFGWDEYEAFAPYECDGRCRRHRERPVFAYGRSKGCSITGGYVVRDRSLRSLYGRYVFADLCAGTVRSFVPRLRRVRAARFSGVSVRNPVSFGEGPNGRLYVVTLDGGVYRFKAAR